MLSDEEKEALRNFKSEYESCDHYSSDLIIELDDAEIILNLIEKQSKEIEEMKKQLDLDNECEIALNSKIMDLEKEIEELKEENKKLTDEYLVQRDLINPDFLKDYINKDKIKAKIEEFEKQQKEEPDAYLCIKALSSLLEKE